MDVQRICIESVNVFLSNMKLNLNLEIMSQIKYCVNNLRSHGLPEMMSTLPNDEDTVRQAENLAFNSSTAIKLYMDIDVAVIARHTQRLAKSSVVKVSNPAFITAFLSVLYMAVYTLNNPNDHKFTGTVMSEPSPAKPVAAEPVKPEPVVAPKESVTPKQDTVVEKSTNTTTETVTPPKEEPSKPDTTAKTTTEKVEEAVAEVIPPKNDSTATKDTSWADAIGNALGKNLDKDAIADMVVKFGIQAAIGLGICIFNKVTKLENIAERRYSPISKLYGLPESQVDNFTTPKHDSKGNIMERVLKDGLEVRTVGGNRGIYPKTGLLKNMMLYYLGD